MRWKRRNIECALETQHMLSIGKESTEKCHNWMQIQKFHNWMQIQKWNNWIQIQKGYNWMQIQTCHY